MQELSISDFSGHTPSISEQDCILFFIIFKPHFIYLPFSSIKPLIVVEIDHIYLIEGDDCVVVVVPCIYLGVIVI